jgi:hypothetical protein
MLHMGSAILIDLKVGFFVIAAISATELLSDALRQGHR